VRGGLERDVSLQIGGGRVGKPLSRVKSHQGLSESD
jgi:hypothetical protein